MRQDIKDKLRYFADLFTTIVDLKWSYHVIIFVATYTITWLAFGFLWWIIAFFRFGKQPRLKSFSFKNNNSSIIKVGCLIFLLIKKKIGCYKSYQLNICTKSNQTSGIFYFYYMFWFELLEFCIKTTFFSSVVNI